jgi:hypothetical protein
MRVAILGATGRTGGAVLERALERGHEVCALVRDPSTLPAHPSLTVVRGGFEDTEALDRAVAGADAVVTAVGITSRARPTLLEDSVRAIRAAMDRAGVTRLVVVQGVHIPVEGDPHNLGLLALKAIMHLLMRPLVLDGRRLHAALAAATGDWTLIRMPQVVVAPPTGRMQVGALRVGPWSRVTSGDVGVLAVACLEQRTYLREAPMVGSHRVQVAPQGAGTGATVRPDRSTSVR